VTSARRQRHGGARSAAIAGALLLATGTLAAAVTAAAQASGSGAVGTVRHTMDFACRFPTGTQHLRLTIAAAFPGSAVAGRRIQPTGVVLTVRLPEASVATLRMRGAATVSATASLSVKASQRATRMTTWQGRATAQQLPAAGSLSLVAPGHAAPVTIISGRRVIFAAASLKLSLHLTDAAADSPSASPSTASPNTASPSAPGAGSASTSATDLHVICNPAGRGGTRLATVPVRAASAHAKSPPHRHKLKLPKGCGHIKVIGSGVAVCGYITGYSDVAKLYGAALLQPKRPARPALVNIDFAWRHVFKHDKLVESSTGDLYYQGHRELPPVRATFLAFGFVPVTATLKVTEVRPISIRSVSGITAPPYPISVQATTTVRIRISDVDVNGVPLAIGPHCRPVTTTRLTLVGRGDNTIPPRGYTLSTGGPLSGRLTIPAFTHCGVTENLDPLLTGSISGPGNFTLMTQGKLCGPSQPQNWTCPPPVPKPIH
jgi:hypothetical protein